MLAGLLISASSSAFLVTPPPGRAARIGVASLARGAFFIESSTSIDGEVARFAARDLGFSVTDQQAATTNLVCNIRRGFFLAFPVFAIGSKVVVK